MVMKKYVELKVYNTGSYKYLYLYYKERNNALKIPTGVKYHPELLDKDNNIKSEYNTVEIRKLRDAINGYITYCYQWHKEINQQDCLLYLKQHYDVNIRVRDTVRQEKTILEYFNDFVNLKSEDLSHYNSMRVYNSLKTNLTEFDKLYKLTLDSINLDDAEFLIKFKNYSYNTLNHIDNTVSKNVAILKKFLKYLQKKTRHSFKSEIFDYTVGKHPSQVVTLTEDEVKEIYYCQKYDKFEKQVIDVFIFLCMTSMRYSDYATLDDAKIENNILTKRNEKTKTSITIPLNDTALEILKRYNYKLPVFANAYLNREIKAIFKKYDLLNTEYVKVSVKNRINIPSKGLKRDFVTVHKSRSTFITLLINNHVPLTEIMPITGHRKVSTLDIYTDTKINPEATNKIAL